MKKVKLLGIAMLSISMYTNAQNIDKVITESSVKNILSVLSSDDMRGRKTFSPEIDRAADFIASEFKKSGLEFPKGSKSYLQKFSLISANTDAVSGTFGTTTLNKENVVVISNSEKLQISEKDNYVISKINAEDASNIYMKVSKLIVSDTNTIVLVDKSLSKIFPRIARFQTAQNETKRNIVFILGVTESANYTIDIQQTIDKKQLENVVGILPGKTKPNEYVIFSGHYDHLGVDPKMGSDSIYNGANDDASGTTAVIELSKYYKKLNNNARTIVFATFTAEEIGGYGSQYFSKQFDPEKVVAMFNIEMIGTDSKWGNNSAYITGFEKTNMGEILQKNLVNSPFKFYPDPYTEQNLFYRSDNATLARQGVPAHTISTSKMDDEPNYHKVSDDISTLNLANMTEIIKSIATSANSIVAGKDTPTRVDSGSLK